MSASSHSIAADDPSTLTLTVAEDAGAGERLDSFVARALAALGQGRAAAQRLCRAAKVEVDGVARRPSRRLQAGERVAVQLPRPTRCALQPQPMALAVLYEDADIVVVDKPAGLVVHPGAGGRGATLVQGLLAHCGDLSGVGGVQRPGIVHRLDAGTSGVMVVAKHDAAHRHLAAQFAAREVDKLYIGVALGQPPTAAGVFATGYGRHPTDRRRFTGRLPWPANAPPPGLAASPAPAAPLLTTRSRVRHAVTAWRQMGARQGIVALQLRLFTGRTHQIRAHLSEQRLPLVGDRLYGRRAATPLPEGAPPAPASQALHARRLTLTHPRRGERLTFVAPPPPPVARWLEWIAAGDSCDGR